MVRTNVRKALEDCTMDIQKKNTVIKVVNMPKLKDIFGEENVVTKVKRNSPVTKHEILIAGTRIAVLTTMSGKLLETRVTGKVKPSKVPLTGTIIHVVPQPAYRRRTK